MPYNGWGVYGLMGWEIMTYNGEICPAHWATWHDIQTYYDIH